MLKKFSNLSEEEQRQVEEYENKHAQPIFKAPQKRETPKRIPITKLDLKELKKAYLQSFKYEEGKDLIVTKENKDILNLVCQYFAKDEAFNDTNLTENIPSLDKGLMLIGGYGCGKTSMMRAFHKIGYKLLPDTFMWFPFYSCNGMVAEYEQLDNQNDKGEFLEKYFSVKKCYFDDFGTEEDASNFGKKNLLKDILEERYLRKKTTYVSTNLSLNEINEKYGERVFSRIQEVFNIIIMNGKDFRK